MFKFLIEIALSKLLFFALHLENNTVFPKPLTAKEETEYFIKMKSGDKSAKNKLIEHNLRLVAHIIKKYYLNSSEQDDLISIGTIGLIKAVNSFDYEKGRFSTFASRCIENEILMHFRKKKKYAGEIHFEEVLDVDKDGNNLTLIDIIPDNDKIFETIDLRIKTKQLYEYVDEILSKRESMIIKMRYGLYDKRPMTQNEVAEKLNISRSYVSRIEKKALNSLRKRFEK